MKKIIIYCLVLVNLAGCSFIYENEYTVEPPINTEGIGKESETSGDNEKPIKETEELIEEKAAEIQQIIAEVEELVAQNPSLFILDSVIPQVSEYYGGVHYLEYIVILLDEGNNEIQIKYTEDLIPFGVSQNIENSNVGSVTEPTIQSFTKLAWSLFKFAEIFEVSISNQISKIITDPYAVIQFDLGSISVTAYRWNYSIYDLEATKSRIPYTE